MDTVRIFIIEDLFTHRKILRKAIEKINLPNLTFTNFSVEDYIGFYDEIDELDILDTDIFIIDIDLKIFYNGIDYAKKIRTINPNCFIIFLTSDDQQGINIINQRIHATSYLVKNVFNLATVEKMLKKEFLTIQETINENYIKYNDQYLFVRTNDSYFNIKLSTIIYIETMKTMKGYLHLKSLTKDMIIKATISELKEQLEAVTFLITNLKSLIINWHEIEAIQSSEGRIVFNNKEELFVGRKTLKKIKAYME